MPASMSAREPTLGRQKIEAFMASVSFPYYLLSPTVADERGDSNVPFVPGCGISRTTCFPYPLPRAIIRHQTNAKVEIMREIGHFIGGKQVKGTGRTAD